mmetsp:Transcript_16929/g.25532  ORF Transcript_16929/g.25532 Transcript_16929/m.25532 type:complete len:1244 (-) Transcript_16929:329-4060(-)|eukprot:CAMPEP_0185037624 /NCGR_PEP_ID=MMETSP1103-20130426/32341_1 /TAXON_ID=36769 /ORGANISM="Paraphysomonas bandaiensis, Strain Caron Lab Isolate" /LENGTH=1243 /DNA_ID=CAMNT_0027575699 /DNA_START=118 /DNA_END=3849 /DNA_ORIENTATION=-
MTTEHNDLMNRNESSGYNQFGDDMTSSGSVSSTWAGIIPMSGDTSFTSPQSTCGHGNPESFTANGFLPPTADDSLRLNPDIVSGLKGLMTEQPPAIYDTNTSSKPTSATFGAGLKNLVSISIPSYTTKIDSDGKYTSFTVIVQTVFSTTEIQRRYKNFLSLHQQLMHRIPKEILPPFPKKKRLGVFEPAFVDERRVALERYLQELVCLQEAWACPQFIEFLDNSHPYFCLLVKVTKLTDEVGYLTHCNGKLSQQLREMTSAYSASCEALTDLQRRMIILENKAGLIRNSRSQENPNIYQDAQTFRDISSSNKERFSSNVGVDYSRQSTSKSESYSDIDSASIMHDRSIPRSHNKFVTDCSDGVPPQLCDATRSLSRSGPTLHAEELPHHGSTPAVRYPQGDINTEKHHTMRGRTSYTPDSFPSVVRKPLKGGEGSGGDSSTSCPVEPLDSHPVLLKSFDTILSFILPSLDQLQYRYTVEKYISKLVRKSLGAQIYQTNIHALRCFLPDDPLSLSIYLCRGLENTWYIRLNEKLCRMSPGGTAGPSPPHNVSGNLHSGDTETPTDTLSQGTEHDTSQANHVISHVNLINERGENCLQCVIGNTTVDIRANLKIDLCFFALLEEIDRAIGGNHLFKKSLSLIRAWWTLEASLSSDVPFTTAQFVPDTSMCIMVCAIFSRHAKKIVHPMHALSLFLVEYSAFNWSNCCLTLYGPVPFSSLETNNSIAEACSTLYPDSLIGSHIISKYETLFKESTEDDVGPVNTTTNFNEQASSGYQKSGVALGNVQGDDCGPDGSESVVRTNVSSEYIKILHPLDPSINTVPDTMTQRCVEVMTEVLKGGHMKLDEILQIQNSLSRGSDDEAVVDKLEAAVFSMFQETSKRYGSGWRPDVFGADIISPIGESENKAPTLSASSFPGTETSQDECMNELGTDYLAPSLDMMWERIRYCNFLLGAQLTETTLRTLSKEILQERGPLPVGEIGKMLQEITCISTLSAYLKDKFGGLKKFLEIFTDDFVISTDHPFNPHVFLLHSLTSDELKSITQGVIPHHITSKASKRRASRKKRLSNGSMHFESCPSVLTYGAVTSARTGSSGSISRTSIQPISNPSHPSASYHHSSQFHSRQPIYYPHNPPNVDVSSGDTSRQLISSHSISTNSHLLHGHDIGQGNDSADFPQLHMEFGTRSHYPHSEAHLIRRVTPPTRMYHAATTSSTGKDHDSLRATPNVENMGQHDIRTPGFFPGFRGQFT